MNMLLRLKVMELICFEDTAMSWIRPGGRICLRCYFCISNNFSSSGNYFCLRYYLYIPAWFKDTRNVLSHHGLKPFQYAIVVFVFMNVTCFPWNLWFMSLRRTERKILFCSLCEWSCFWGVTEIKHWLAFPGCWIYLPILQMRMEIIHLKEKLYNLFFGCLNCLSSSDVS